MAEKRRIPKRKITVPKECYFCANKKDPKYSDVASLQKFVSDRGKIIVRTRSGICSKHQRQLTTAIKHARHLALLPFVSRD
ncbi:MAG TPA: 30S ribosomal protein S18 [Candidatus Saccharimonadales bacterium]|nr:30S ribosomal protein S18 [Candidatus Saccharimonadales bacterium]